jgi:hypothetical protein
MISLRVGHITVEIATTPFEDTFGILIVDARLKKTHKIPPFRKE